MRARQEAVARRRAHDIAAGRLGRALVALAVCLGGCECDEPPRLDGPVSVWIDDPIEVRGGTGRSIPGPSRAYYIVFESAAGDPVPARYSTGCWYMPELVADEARERIAWRCGESGDDGAWKVAYRDGTELLMHCAFAPTGTIDWSTAPTREQALPDLMSCHDEPERFFRAARERGGDALLELVLASRHAELPMYGGGDAWEVAYLELPDAEQARVREALREDAARAGVGSATLWRALVTGGLDDPARLESRLAEILAQAPWDIPNRAAPGLTPTGPWQWLIPAAVRRLAQRRSPRAGELACLAVMIRPDRYADMRQHAAIALAALRHSCAPLVESFPSCSTANLCGSGGARRPCTTEELLAAADAAIAADPIEAVRAPIDAGVPFPLAAVSVAGVPERITHASGRLAYAVEPTEGPSCFAPESVPGEPCVCWRTEHDRYRTLCAMAGEGAASWIDPRCALTIDDDAHTIRVVRAP